MTQAPYDRLIRMLDAYIDEYGGRLRLRGVLTALLVLKSSLSARGISISEVRRVTGAPLENVRRHFAKHVELGNLTSHLDPDDERVTRYLFLDLDTERARACRVAQALYSIGPPSGEQASPPAATLPFTTSTCDALMEALQAFTDSLDSSLRIRAFKIAIAMHQASLTSNGMTPTQIARVSGAPLETVRRTLQRYLDIGDLQIVGDPDDDRASRIHYRDPARSEANIHAMARRLGKIDWSLFNTH